LIDKHGNVTSNRVQAYLYHKTELDLKKNEYIEHGDWLRRDKKSKNIASKEIF